MPARSRLQIELEAEEVEMETELQRRAGALAVEALAELVVELANDSEDAEGEEQTNREIASLRSQ